MFLVLRLTSSAVHWVQTTQQHWVLSWLQYLLRYSTGCLHLLHRFCLWESFLYHDHIGLTTGCVSYTRMPLRIVFIALISLIWVLAQLQFSCSTERAVLPYRRMFVAGWFYARIANWRIAEVFLICCSHLVSLKSGWFISMNLVHRRFYHCIRSKCPNVYTCNLVWLEVIPYRRMILVSVSCFTFYL